MLFLKLFDHDCTGLIALCVIYLTLTWVLALEAVKQWALLTVVIFVELTVAIFLSKVSNASAVGQIAEKNYRSQTSHSSILMFLVPLCVLKDTTSANMNLDQQGRYDALWFNLSLIPIILAKYTSLNERPSFKIYGFAASILFCLVVHVLSRSSLLSFTISAIFIWKGLHVIPSLFPKSFSFGEVVIVLQLFCDWMQRMMNSIINFIDLDENDHIKWTGSTIVAAVTLGTLMLYISKSYRSLIASSLIYILHAILSVAFLSWMFQKNFILWIFTHFFQDCIHLTLIVSWLLVFAVTILWTISQTIVDTSLKLKDKSQENQSTPISRSHLGTYDDNATSSVHDGKSAISSTSSSLNSYNNRKIFHFFILLVYVPGLLLDPQLLLLSSCAAFGAFFILETLRFLNVPLIGPLTDSILRPFTDERDQGPLFLTHIYLLVGMSLPLWITSSPIQAQNSPIKFYSGVLSLGIGDTIACIVGSACGKTRWPGTKKTVEGSIASVVAQMAFTFVLFFLDIVPVNNFLSLWIGVTITSLVEAFTDQIDNLVLPLVIFPFLC